jgi:membrane protease YdiL (CAAX protease family)
MKEIDNKEQYKHKADAQTKIPPRRPVWNVWQGLFLLLLIYLVEFPLGWLRTPQDLEQLQGFFRFLAVGLGEVILYFVVILVFFKLIKRPLSELGFVRPRGRYVFLGVLMGIVLFIAVGLLGSFLANWLGTPAPQSFTLVVKGAEYNWQFFLLLILGGILAPLKEEVIFRGIFYPPFRNAYGRGKGIVFTAGLFALLHFDVVRFIPLFIGGIVLTWLYEKTSSLWPSILAHGTWNILMALALWIQRNP